MKVGDLVSLKIEPWEYNRTPDYGEIGIVTEYDGYGKFKVLWSKRSKSIPHDMYEIRPYESR